MSHISLVVSSDNPVNREVLEATIPSWSHPPVSLPERDVEDYTKILAGTHEVYKKILEMPDYIPTVEISRFPRNNVHRPRGTDNPRNAWAWRCSIKGEQGGVLSGKRICLKDNIAVKDVPCEVGTDIFTDWTPATDATVVTRVLEAGGEVVGKAVCENLSFFAASVSPASGHVHNAYAEGYSAGGSSTGAAVLVAVGEADMAIGGDQGGSIRTPAAQNGLVGMKPTHGLCPWTGITLLEWTFDTAGPMTKTVEDNALLLQVLAGADRIDDRQVAGCPYRKEDVPDYPLLCKGSPKGLRIGIIGESLKTDVSDPRYTNLVLAAAAKYKDLGVSVEHVSLPGLAFANDLWMVTARLSVYNNLTGRAAGRRSLYLNDFTSKFLPLTQDKVDKMWPSAVITYFTGAYGWEKMDPTLYGKSMNLARKFRDEVDALLDQYDLLLTPTMPRLPQRIDHLNKDSSPLEKMATAGGVGLNTAPFNLTGHPAISIPVGMLSPLDRPEVSLPVGMQLVGKHYDEATIYRAAYAWEQANDWKAQAAASEVVLSAES